MQTGILDRVSAAVAELSKSERRVAQAVLDDPALAARENIADLARRAKVSQPTVFRFCRHFGAEGFPDFKLTLSAALTDEPQHLAKQVSAGDRVGDVARKVIGGIQGALKDLERGLDENVLARAIDIVSQARRILVCAQGHSAAAALDFRSRLAAMGMSCEIVSDPVQMLLSAAALRQGDLCIGISSTGENRDVCAAVRGSREGGASVLTVCPPETTLAALAVLALRCGFKSDPDDELMCGRFAAMALLQIILAGVSLRRADLVRPLRPRLKAAVAAVSEGAQSAKTAEVSSPSQSGALKPDEPITALDWTL
ncbi:MAG: MurR/RpiR family transcriptional regulator [Succinivibrio sp.]|jgi:RpiR family carbohydrate utilization transcriptional regulator|nr:MurR/RpiR family transcriptional regulator [Succinivibrio sp.]